MIQPHGAAVFLLMLPLVYPAAVKQPPAATIAEYSMNGAVPIEYFFVDDSNGTGTHYTYGPAYIRSMLEGSKKYLLRLENKFPPENLKSVSEFTLNRLRIHKNDWIYLALLKYREAVMGRKVAIIGSSEPRIEVIATIFGAKSITTVEYNKLTYGDGIIIPVRTISAPQFEHFYSSNFEEFDVVLSISSIEHDGLGRYGDPLNPRADLDAMKKISSILKPDGLLMLSVPIGPDVTVFNLHRRYGNLRLPVLLEGWTTIDCIPWDKSRMTKEANWRQTYEPVFVLQWGGVPETSQLDSDAEVNAASSVNVDL